MVRVKTKVIKKREKSAPEWPRNLEGLILGNIVPLDGQNVDAKKLCCSILLQISEIHIFEKKNYHNFQMFEKNTMIC